MKNVILTYVGFEILFDNATENPHLLTLIPCRWRLPITLGQFCGVCLAGEEKKHSRML